MYATLSAAFVLVLLVLGLFLGRRRSRPFLRSTDTSAVVALNRVQIERLRQAAPAALASLASRAAAAAARTSVPRLPDLPRRGRQRYQRLQQLQAWMKGSRQQRLAVLELARRSPQRDLLPLLRRALRDPDPAVMAAAAAAMARLRGRPEPSRTPAIPVRWQGRTRVQAERSMTPLPPRSVERMR